MTQINIYINSFYALISVQTKLGEIIECRSLEFYFFNYKHENEQKTIT